MDVKAAENGQGTKYVIPTLYIGLGGTGLEVLLRLRRRMLTAAWGPRGQRLNSLDDFPAAEFLYYDLDRYHERFDPADPLAELIRIPQQDCLGWDLLGFGLNMDTILRSSHIASWFPEDERDRLSKHSFGPSRCVPRLHFFVHYNEIRDAISRKLSSLREASCHQERLSRLGLEAVADQVRVVVLCSAVGGTGSGTFLDMGWLAQILARRHFSGRSTVDLCLFTPSGYDFGDHSLPRAFGYAAFMELETAMRGMVDHMSAWDPNEGMPDLPTTPYTDVFLLENANLVGQSISSTEAVWDMAAGALFENITGGALGERLRMSRVHKEVFKLEDFCPAVPEDFHSVKLPFSRRYSSFGRAVLETPHAGWRNQLEYRLAAAMLEAHFGLTGQDRPGIRATDTDLSNFLKEHLHLGISLYSPTAGLRQIGEIGRLSAAFPECELTETLLRDEGGSIENALLKLVGEAVGRIVADPNSVNDWALMSRAALADLEEHAGLGGTGNDTDEVGGLERQTRRMAEEMRQTLREQLNAFLNDGDQYGLDFALSLAVLLRDSLAHPDAGLARLLDDNACRYRALGDAIRDRLISDTLNGIDAAATGGIFGGPKMKKALAGLEMLKLEMGHFLRCRVRSAAAAAGARLLRELSDYLGGPSGTDARGGTVHAGLTAEIQDSRESILDMCRTIRGFAQSIEDAAASARANRIDLRAEFPEPNLPDGQELRLLAREAFSDFARAQLPVLMSANGRRQLLQRLHAHAASVCELLLFPIGRQGDPLQAALLQMSPVERRGTFTRLFRGAMPWIDAELSDLGMRPDQFTCLLGVEDAQQWDVLREELVACLPQVLSPGTVQIVSTGEPGRAVCHVELTGIPLAALRGLRDWRAAYLEHERRCPMHTHCDISLFVEPQPPTVEELRRLAGDFRLFLLAVLLRQLVRKLGQDIPPGLYRFNFGLGDMRSLGNERIFRRYGLPTDYRSTVQAAVDELLQGLSPLQLFALSRLADYTARETYTPKLVTEANGYVQARPSLPHAVATKLAEELDASARERCRSQGLNAEELARASGLMEELLKDWTETVEGSEEDGYDSERQQSEPGHEHCKRRVKKEFFIPGWLEDLCGLSPSISPPPLPLQDPWWFGINNQKVGPCDSTRMQELIDEGTVDETTLAWRKGMAGWRPAGEVPDLASLFSPPPLDEEGPPPLG